MTSKNGVKPGQLWKYGTPLVIPVKRSPDWNDFECWLCHAVYEDGIINVREWQWPDDRWELVNDV